MTSNEKNLASDLLSNKISEEKFLEKRPSSSMHDYIQKGLEHTLIDQDGESVGYLIRLGAVFDFNDETVKVLCKLLLEGWHREQEEIARQMQQRFSNSVCIETVATAMQSRYKHMPSDDLRFPFVIKCAYALADSGKAEGIEKLKELTRSEDEVVHLSAQWQLDRLDGKNPEDLIW